MIVLIAPYSPHSRTLTPNLGAARKIEAVVQILARTGERIVLVNSVNDGPPVSGVFTRAENVCGVDVIEITPSVSRNQRTGKLLNLLEIPRVRDAVFACGEPIMVWLYNAYAFESLLGRSIHRKSKVPVVLEMEDWHFSRSRGLNPKPVVDYVASLFLKGIISQTFAVNEAVAEKVKRLGGGVDLFPGVVSDAVAQMSEKSCPFSQGRGVVRVGYFGGLVREKGADIVAELVNAMPVGFKFIVTGSGELASRFQDLSRRHPERIEFYGTVAQEKLFALLSECDIILNPHVPLDQMRNGVFPFKVVEAVASGRLVISTWLPVEGLQDVLSAVRVVEHDVQSFKSEILRGAATYAARENEIRGCARAASARFSISAVTEKVRAICRI